MENLEICPWLHGSSAPWLLYSINWRPEDYCFRQTVIWLIQMALQLVHSSARVRRMPKCSTARSGAWQPLPEQVLVLLCSWYAGSAHQSRAQHGMAYTRIESHIGGKVNVLVNWSVGQLVNWSVGQLVNWSVGQLVSWSTGQLVNCLDFNRHRDKGKISMLLPAIEFKSVCEHIIASISSVQ